jgi:EAL domain-containing protein (putative c-di-GMP-specific phosphodiesterase class I)
MSSTLPVSRDDAAHRPAMPSRLRRLRTLNTQAEAAIDAALTQARALALQAEELARELGANGELALSLMVQSKVHFYEHGIDEALQLMRRAAALAESDGHLAVRAKVLTALGALWASLGLGEQALPHLEAASECLSGGADAAGVALVQSLLGGVLAQMGQTERGRVHLEQALEAFTQLRMAARAREARHNLGCLANLQHRHAIALALSDISSKEAAKAGDRMFAHIEATAADALAGLGRHGEAAQRARRALETTPAHTRGAYDLLLALGRAELAAGRLAEAGGALTQALEIGRSGGQPDDALLVEALAGWCERRGDAAAATAWRARLAQAREGGGTEPLAWRLKALQASVELQTLRMRYGHVAAERARLSAQLEHSRRLLAAEGLQAADTMLLDDAFASAHPGFDAAFDGASAGYGLRYQPLVDLADGRVLGFEALLRLTTKPGGRAAPLEFIRRLEAGGEIGSVGHWVLRRACDDLVALQADVPRPLRLVVNVSSLELERGDFAADVLEVIARAGLPAARVELDLGGFDESSPLGAVQRQLLRLREAGVGLTLDGFGAGHMPWSLLAELPLTRLKIDRSIVASAGQGERHDALLASLLQTAANLKLPVGAVGIENAAQWHGLRALGCREAQGFLFATPLTLAAAQQLPRRLPAD